MEFIIVSEFTPWPDQLPGGTEIERVEAPVMTDRSSRSNEQVYATNWFRRVDGEPCGDRKDRCFRLFANEIISVTE